jgi:hypothetical protein
MQIDSRLINGETIEKDVFILISECLSQDEGIVFGGEFDYLLPDGVKKLKWPKNTAIEIKYRLIYNSISKIREIYDRLQPSKLIVVVMNENMTSLKLTNNASRVRRPIEVISYQDLYKKISAIDISNTDYTEEENCGNKYQDNVEANIQEKVKGVLKRDKISIFLGAGVSASAGVVTWNSLLEQLCIKKGLPKIDSDIESVIKGRYIIDAYKKQQKEIPDDFYIDMRNILYANIHSSKLINSIAKLIATSNIESIISYNYDDLVEQKVNEEKPCYSVFDKSRPIDGSSLHVYHVHGFIPQNGDWSPIVLGEKEYHQIYQESYNWGNVEQLHALCRSACLFIGLSMNDPNLRRLIDISNDGGEVEPVHYAFLRKIEYDVPFMEKIMRGFGINCVWYERHEDLPKLLETFIS